LRKPAAKVVAGIRACVGAHAVCDARDASWAACPSHATRPLAEPPIFTRVDPAGCRPDARSCGVSMSLILSRSHFQHFGQARQPVGDMRADHGRACIRCVG
jgi:hypothetical protein